MYQKITPISRLLLHSGFWCAYLFLQVYVGAELSNPSYADRSLVFRMSKILYGELLVLPTRLLITYALLYYFLPQFNRERFILWLIKLALTLVIGLTIYRWTIGYVVTSLVYGEITRSDNFAFARYLWSFFDVFGVAAVALTIKLFRLRQREKEQQQILEQQRLETELRLLRSQTNPHFLFNTLNNIYALARKKSDQTAPVVLKLSHLLRFMLYECNAPTIALNKEIQLIEDYLALEKLRYPQRLTVTFTKNIQQANWSIAPLLLLPLVENAFKHGVSETRFDSFINLHLETDRDRLYFTIKNSKEDAIMEEENHGIGLKNTQRQLELLYPKHHDWKVIATEQLFTVALTIYQPTITKTT